MFFFKNSKCQQVLTGHPLVKVDLTLMLLRYALIRNISIKVELSYKRASKLVFQLSITNKHFEELILCQNVNWL